VPASSWLNYHHLLYFWTVAREGSLAAASKRLRLAQPTISTQIKTLEDQLGVALFDRSGRKLELTEVGKLAYRYADDIFSLGRELVEALHEGPARPLRLNIGVTHVIPKLIAYRLIEPARGIGEGVLISCQHDRFDRLLTQLARHELDLVISDVPLGPEVSVKAFNHLLGQSEVSLFAAPSLATKLRRNFPASLDGAPFLLPSAGAMLRRELDRWFEAENLEPAIVGEFDDSALLKVFGQSGLGVFAAPSVIEAEIKQQYDVQVIGRAATIHERFYAITIERRIRHPGAVAISQGAKTKLFTS
jgi:LysR family transcriptional activator of nhaA